MSVFFFFFFGFEHGHGLGFLHKSGPKIVIFRGFNILKLLFFWNYWIPSKIIESPNIGNQQKKKQKKPKNKRGCGLGPGLIL